MPRALLPCLLFACSALAACHSAERRVATRVYVSNEDSNDVTVIDPATDRAVATIAVGKRPRGLRLSPDGKTLYVALSGSPKGGPGVDDDKLPPPDRSADGIGVIDVATEKLVRVLPAGQDPESFDVSPDGKRIWVSNEDSAEATVIDVASGKVAHTVAVGREPEGVTLRPDGAFVYVTGESSNEVAVIRAGTHDVVARIPTGARPRAVAFTPDGKRAFVTAEMGAALQRIDSESHRAMDAIRLPAGARPMGVRVSPDGKHVWVTTGRAGSVIAIDTRTGDVERTIEHVGARPWGVDLTPDGKKIYVANGPSNDVAVIDAERGEVVAHVPAGKSPWGVAVATRRQDSR